MGTGTHGTHPCPNCQRSHRASGPTLMGALRSWLISWTESGLTLTAMDTSTNWTRGWFQPSPTTWKVKRLNGWPNCMMKAPPNLGDVDEFLQELRTRFEDMAPGQEAELRSGISSKRTTLQMNWCGNSVDWWENCGTGLNTFLSITSRSPGSAARMHLPGCPRTHTWVVLSGGGLEPQNPPALKSSSREETQESLRSLVKLETAGRSKSNPNWVHQVL